MSSESRFTLFGITPLWRRDVTRKPFHTFRHHALDGALDEKGPENVRPQSDAGRPMLCLLYGEGKRLRGQEASWINTSLRIDARVSAALQLMISR